MTETIEKLGKPEVYQADSEGQPVDTLERMARITASDGKTDTLTMIGWAAALTTVILGGIAIAAGFLAPGLTLAGSLPTNATGAHPWIVDGGSEIATDLPWRLQITVEYIAMGLAVIALMLRFGKVWLTKLQDWYEAGPAPVPAQGAEGEPEPQISQFPQPLRRPGAGGKNPRKDPRQLRPA
jgi:hypothetical protein